MPRTLPNYQVPAPLGTDPIDVEGDARRIAERADLINIDPSVNGVVYGIATVALDANGDALIHHGAPWTPDAVHIITAFKDDSTSITVRSAIKRNTLTATDFYVRVKRGVEGGNYGGITYPVGTTITLHWAAFKNLPSATPDTTAFALPALVPKVARSDYLGIMAPQGAWRVDIREDIDRVARQLDTTFLHRSGYVEVAGHTNSIHTFTIPDTGWVPSVVLLTILHDPGDVFVNNYKLVWQNGRYPTSTRFEVLYNTSPIATAFGRGWAGHPSAMRFYWTYIYWGPNPDMKLPVNDNGAPAGNGKKLPGVRVQPPNDVRPNAPKYAE
jgi:hypothetical protein